jgi:hypothetical protein
MRVLTDGNRLSRTVFRPALWAQIRELVEVCHLSSPFLGNASAFCSQLWSGAAGNFFAIIRWCNRTATVFLRAPVWPLRAFSNFSRTLSLL